MTFTDARLVQHCAVFGRLTTPVRACEIRPVAPYAQYATSITVVYIKPRCRRRYAYQIKNDNLRYLTIEVNGATVYDSRADVPCDMAEWNAVNEEFRQRRNEVSR